MDRRTPRYQFISFLIILVISVVSIVLVTLVAMDASLHDRLTQNATNEGLLLARLVSPQLATPEAGSVDSLCKSVQKSLSGRVTVIDSTGRVVGDGLLAPKELPTMIYMSDVAEALKGNISTRVQFDSAAKGELWFISVPVRADQQILGAVRIGVVEQEFLTFASPKILIAGIVVVLILGGFAGYITVRRTNRITDAMLGAAERFAQGDFNYRVPAQNAAVDQYLADSMNTMAVQLDERIRAVSRQRNEQSAILSSMIEGVIAIDSSEKIISINQAACSLVGADEQFSIGRSVRAVVRQSHFHQLVEKTLTTAVHQEDLITLTDGGEKQIQVSCTVLADASGEPNGAVVVMNDVTKIRKLENLRRDFVANVSHELRTPITSIKGFVETLADGAIDDPESARKFIGIIQKHVERLNGIIEDLLALSGIEDAAEKSQIVFKREMLAAVINAAVQTSSEITRSKQIAVTITCPPELEANINAALFEQAITNLIDNAVRYSQPSGKISISVTSGKDITMAVADTGCGIEAEHLPRLFERFYRVDKSRNRAQGGTGLGLAIVKHIALAHGGSVSVESTPGAGSTFRIHLPRLA